MDTQTIRILEFDRIQDILKRYALSPLGQSEIEGLTILTEPDQIQPLLNCTTEMSALIREKGRPSLQGSSEIRPLLDRVRVVGSCLNPEELLDVSEVIRNAQALKQYMKNVPEEFPNLKEETRDIDPLFELGKVIGKTVDERGGIKDTASGELATIRRKIRRQKEQVRERLEGILSSKNLQTVIQERLVTIRNDRYVIPLRPDFSSKIGGIIHDHSSSGVTVYVEPSETVEMNNRLSRLASEEAEEVHRILLEISGRVRSSTEHLRRNVEILARTDLHLSKALFAEDFQATAPGILEERKIDFKGARHPLLLDKRERPGRAEVVPIDLCIGDGYRTLMITGPNTGGKTVSLKTLGLLVLMAQAGIPIPVKQGSTMGVFDNVFADIGDEQSIQEDLSTFSSHIGNIVQILEASGDASLVLLDELGTGTDPREGAALGMAILEELSNTGALTAASTHYEEIKHFAYRTEGMMNASVAFDSEQLRPTYCLEYGHLGTSHAFDISRKIGMPDRILNQAREKISDLDRSTAQLIEELEEEILKNQAVGKELNKRQQEMESLLSAKEQEKEEALKEVQKRRQELMDQSARIKKRARTLLKTAEQGDRMGLESEINRMDQELEQVGAGPTPPPQMKDIRWIKPGLPVEVSGTGRKGVVVSGPDKRERVHVVCNGLKIEVAANRLKAVSADASQAAPRVALQAERSSHEEVAHRINLIGLRVEEAQRKTEKYLDSAHLENLRYVEIIHGIGTGTLREAIAELLKSHPFVADFRPGDLNSGGAGVTVVELVS